MYLTTQLCFSPVLLQQMCAISWCGQVSAYYSNMFNNWIIVGSESHVWCMHAYTGTTSTKPKLSNHTILAYSVYFRVLSPPSVIGFPYIFNMGFPLGDNILALKFAAMYLSPLKRNPKIILSVHTCQACSCIGTYAHAIIN